MAVILERQIYNLLINRLCLNKVYTEAYCFASFLLLQQNLILKTELNQTHLRADNVVLLPNFSNNNKNT